LLHFKPEYNDFSYKKRSLQAIENWMAMDIPSTRTLQYTTANVSASVIKHGNFFLQVGFWGLLAICFMNLNGVTAMVLGQSRVMSVALLLCGLTILLNMRSQVQQCIGRSCKAFVLFMLVYLTLGMAGNSAFPMFVSHLNSIFIVVVGSVAAFELSRLNGAKAVMLPLAVFTTLGASTVFLTPILAPYYTRIKNSEMAMNAGRWLGFFANPNETGMAAVIALACCLITYQLYRRTMVSRLIMISSVLILLLAVFLTFSRGAVLSFIAIGSLYLLSSKERHGSFLGIMIAASIGLTIAYWFFSAGYKDFQWTYEQRARLESINRMISSDGLSEADLGSRWSGVEAGLDYWGENPIFGNGLGTMRAMPYRYFGGLGCHNTHLTVLGEVGLVGFLFYMLWILLYIQDSLRVSNSTIKGFLFLAIGIFAIYGSISHGILDARGPNLLLGVCFGLLHRYNAFGGAHAN
jgi:hypothetical protein